MIFYRVIPILIQKIQFFLLVLDDVAVSGIKKISRLNFLIRMFLSLSTVFKFGFFED